MLKMEKPSEAVRYFDDAARLGVKDADIASDRGLALDLTGDPERAQREYKLALDRRPGDPEILRRYAVSLGITGKWQDAERLLDPLLRPSDKPAWRDRPFTLDMHGRTRLDERRVGKEGGRS